MKPIALIFVMLLAVSASADAIKEWKTPDGRTYFGDHPPEGSTVVKTVDRPISTVEIQPAVRVSAKALFFKVIPRGHLIFEILSKADFRFFCCLNSGFATQQSAPQLLAEPVAPAPDLDGDRVVEQPIEDRHGDRGRPRPTLRGLDCSSGMIVPRSWRRETS